MDERERQRILRERELEADLDNASDLFGAASLDPSRKAASSSTAANAQANIPSHLKPLLALPAQIKTKADFEALSKAIYESLIKPHSSSPQFVGFVEQHSRALCSTLKEPEIKKVANGLTNLANQSSKGPAARKAKAPALGGKGMMGGQGGGKGK